MRRHAAAAFVVGLVSLATRAEAQTLEWNRLKETVVPSEESPDQPVQKKKPKEKPSGFFDMANTTVGLELDGGPVWYRTQGQSFRPGTLSLGAGQTTTSSLEHVYLAGSLRTVFRAFDATTYLWTFLQPGFATGVRAGPLELEAQIGLGLLGISATRGEWSLDILAPRVGVAAAAHVGRFRLAVGAHSEYLWRLFGMGYTARSLTVSVRFDLTPALP